MAAHEPPATRIFAVKTTGGQERTVANFVQARLARRPKLGEKVRAKVGTDLRTKFADREGVVLATEGPNGEILKVRFGEEDATADANALEVVKSVYAVLVVDAMKGYVFVEAANAQVAAESVAGFKHVKSQVPGIIQLQDIEKFLITRDILAELGDNDTVEIIAGPFKGMRARITRIEPQRAEVTIILLDAPYQLPVTVDANYLKIVEKAKAAVAA
jgi:transcriptional antiterminator NusG